MVARYHLPLAAMLAATHCLLLGLPPGVRVKEPLAAPTTRRSPFTTAHSRTLKTIQKEVTQYLMDTYDGFEVPVQDQTTWYIDDIYLPKSPVRIHTGPLAAPAASSSRSSRSSRFSRFHLLIMRGLLCSPNIPPHPPHGFLSPPPSPPPHPELPPPLPTSPSPPLQHTHTHIQQRPARARQRRPGRAAIQHH